MSVLINVPETAAPGEIVTIRILIQHPMETGFRTGRDGALVPRDIIESVACLYQGEEVFRADLFPAITANPILSFHLRAGETGRVEFVWTDNSGVTARDGRLLTVA
ncbi:thiosulfate oxidation carrier complex protein SoxZ [Pararhodobacter zhoushanensis]|uniref:Thiosulfate oxidation carrier complex protein SoxZ n=1 Tax=Pararhodobacter zhoushanensis TaxID=2479545 RepID=A0ABT3H4D3_9RHOB|nr:thiosulfate oxidation carrier complex protein SoxZ [Pararhodobacter zhoushanensis]MCW1934608.1 thiosulfate oxidation carrier complex protein SoxZ [Pararhodobacter zhoushanensis]